MRLIHARCNALVPSEPSVAINRRLGGYADLGRPKAEPTAHRDRFDRAGVCEHPVVVRRFRSATARVSDDVYELDDADDRPVWEGVNLGDDASLPRL